MMMRITPLALAIGLFLGSPSVSFAREENTLPCYEGYSALRAQAYDQSLAAFSDCLADPGLSATNRAVAHTNRGNGYAAKGQYQEALKEYDLAIAAKPDYVVAYMNRGIARSNQGEQKLATDDLKKAKQLDPYNPEVLNALCWTNSLMGLARESLSYCDFAWARAPRVANILDTRAFTYWQLGLPERAQQDLDTAHSIDPSGAYLPDRRLAVYPVILTQGLLSTLGYAPGLADGDYKPETQAAIEAFERDRGLPVTGRINETLIDLLKSAL